jgi:xylulokinase
VLFLQYKILGMYLLGIDIGSSSVKVSLIEVESGKSIASAFAPKKEMEILSVKPGWAEQEPESWWENLRSAIAEIKSFNKIKEEEIKAIGISYQMHGLVLVDKNKKLLRPSIIWCDSRAVEIGNKAFSEMGGDKCLERLLNSPGNFTASKLKWVKDNEPEIYSQIYKMMLPGDYIAMKLTGCINTTNTGLSEGILWDFKENQPAEILLTHYGISKDLIPDLVPVFSNQGNLTKDAATELGLSEKTIVAYRGGDQPNNALSLNVLNPGEIAATAGTSGVIYGITDKVSYDPLSRVNSFAHVNHTKENIRLGVLLCINGTGILNSWIKNKMLAGDNTLTYPAMNDLASKAPIGSEGLTILPFGNGAERVLQNKNSGAQIEGLNFNIHTLSHMIRAAQEGIVFALNYGLEVMKETGVKPDKIRAGLANMFLSPVFSNSFASVSGAVVELYNTDGAQGAARGAGFGAGVYTSLKEAFSGLETVKTIEPDKLKQQEYQDAYQNWLTALNKKMKD